MIKKIRNIDVNYIQYGKGEDVVLLHGWGQNIQMMEPLGKNLDNKRITILDFPGFGSSENPDFAYTIYDYRDFLHDFLEELKIKNPILIGHSFGGRVAICYAACYSISKLVLMGSPFKATSKKSLKVKILKTLKKIKFLDKIALYMKNYIGSEDYKAARGIMKEVLVNTVNADLTLDATKIKAETLLIWGDKDEAVSVDDAKELEKIIPDAALIVLSGTHYCYLENLLQVTNILKHFI